MWLRTKNFEIGVSEPVSRNASQRVSALVPCTTKSVAGNGFTMEGAAIARVGSMVNPTPSNTPRREIANRR